MSIAEPQLLAWAIAAYDRAYRFLHGLDGPESEVGPVLRIEVRRSLQRLTLDDGTLVRRGDRIGVLHLNNARVAALRSDGLGPIAVGLTFRRHLLASLAALAEMTMPDGRFASVGTFSAATIFHAGLTRLGFERTRDRLLWAGLVAAYQRALLSSLRRGRPVRLNGPPYQQARRVWISRERLIALYGARQASKDSGGLRDARVTRRTLDRSSPRSPSITPAKSASPSRKLSLLDRYL